MMNISKIDKNFDVSDEISREGIAFYDIKCEPFSVHGVFYENGAYVRMPDSVAASVSDGVRILAKNTAGGRVRFITDSPYIAVKAVQKGRPDMSHMPATGQAGIDLYENINGEEIFSKTFIPESKDGGFERIYDFSTSGEHNVTLNLPLYFNLCELYIGLKKGSSVKKAPDYSVKVPIVYYGSSITQGGCASRPGNSYQGFLSRWYDADYINLGFSGNAKGEDNMAEYIASLDMSCFVYDYDHNAPSARHLELTHEKFYKIIRAAHPDIPILFMSRPKIYLTEDEKLRSDIVYKTYRAALSRGENVYHIFSNELMELSGDEGTVDGCHPTDLGFFSMAKRIKLEFDKFIDKIR